MKKLKLTSFIVIGILILVSFGITVQAAPTVTITKPSYGDCDCAPIEIEFTTSFSALKTKVVFIGASTYKYFSWKGTIQINTIDSKNWKLTIDSFNCPADDIYTIKVMALHSTKGWFTTKVKEVKIDNTGPTAICTIFGINSKFFISADDGCGIGVEKIRYKFLTSSGWSSWTTVFSHRATGIVPPGAIKIRYYAVDCLGNAGVKTTMLIHDFPPIYP